MSLGSPRRVHLQRLADRVKSKLVGWKGKLLSMAGRVQLVHSVFQAMLLHSFAVYKWPVSLLNSLMTHARNFIWSGDLDSRKLLFLGIEFALPSLKAALVLKI